MNYYAARQKQGDKKWHYTCQNDGQIWPVGFCSPWISCPLCGEKYWTVDRSKDCERCGGKGIVESDNPCPGHDTPEEAREHYKQYLLHHATIHGPKKEEWPKNKCAVKECNEEAKYLASVDSYENYEFCEKHANKETLATLMRVGESCSS